MRNEQSNGIVVRGNYNRELSDAQKIQVLLDGKPFDAKLDKQRSFSQRRFRQVLVNSSSKQLSTQVVDGTKVISTKQHKYDVNTSANMAGVL